MPMKLMKILPGSLQTEIEEDCGVSFSGRIKNKQKRAAVKYRKGFELDEKFKDIWDKIKYQTTYKVDYDSHELIKKAAKAVNQMPVTKKRLSKQRKLPLNSMKQASLPTSRHHITSLLKESFAYLMFCFTYRKELN